MPKVGRVDRPVRIIVSGCRKWDSARVAGTVLQRLRDQYGDGNITLVHGDCRSGIDAIFDEYARLMHLKIERFPAMWEDIRAVNAVVREGRHGEYNANAGPNRNQAMVDSGADFVICCHRDIRASRGTKDLARRAMAAKIPVYLIDNEDGVVRRVREGELG